LSLFCYLQTGGPEIRCKESGVTPQGERSRESKGSAGAGAAPAERGRGERLRQRTTGQERSLVWTILFAVSAAGYGGIWRDTVRYGEIHQDTAKESSRQGLEGERREWDDREVAMKVAVREPAGDCDER